MKNAISRRDFLKVSGVAVLGTAAGATSRGFQPQPSSEKACEVAVIGAGIAGLAAATFLGAKDVLVLEKAAKAGGRVIGGKYRGLSYAQGAEYLGEPQGAWARLVKQSGLKVVDIPAPMDALFREGKVHRGETGIARYLIENSSIKDYNRFGGLMRRTAEAYDEQDEFDPESDLGGLDRITAREWFVKEKIPQAIYEAYNVSCRGLFGASLEEVAALSVVPEFGFDFEGFTPYKSLPDQEEAEEGEGSGAYTFMHGISELTDGLAAKLGERLICGADVTSVKRIDDAYEVSYRDQDGAARSLTAETVILAVPAPIALIIAGKALSRERKNLLGQIPYAQYITVALMSKTPLFNQAFDLALPDGRFLTDLYDSTWVEKAYDPKARAVDAWIATAYVARQSYQEQDLIGLKNEEILRRLSADLADFIPDLTQKVTEYRVQRFAYAYPVLTPGAYERIARLQELNGEDELYLAGDYMTYPTFEDAAESGYEAAQDYLSLATTSWSGKTFWRSSGV